ncbi:hypothetical protein HW560_11810 [Paenibacillus sp. E222]|uniref:hypothetical protein n=1 Tax=Paenibacillus sp. E222 TaxID=2748863 RepID=UPI0015C67053|nr:hypothetical protein [Paenibacillus sp. E222]QLG38725.1 hypothetical protein HW560_11810 [Paenibacillus sp. E222]
MAAYLLFKSVESRIHSCRYSQGIYKGIYCDWSEPISGVSEIIKLKPDMWKEWIAQTKCFLENDQFQSYRPTIDRINTDPSIGYRLSNIAMLPFGQNSYKAQAKPVYAFEMGNNQSNVIPTFRRYDSITDAKKDLGLPKLENDTGVFTNTQDGKTFILQSSATTVGEQSVELDSNESEQKVYTGYIPIGQVEIDGQLYTINQPFTFEQMQIKLKNQA